VDLWRWWRQRVRALELEGCGAHLFELTKAPENLLQIDLSDGLGQHPHEDLVFLLQNALGGADLERILSLRGG
jgi:hypothetical protein